MTDVTNSQEGVLTPSTTFDLKYMAILPHTPEGGTPTPFDLSNQFQELNLYQDLGFCTTASPSITGQLYLADGWDIMDTMPILGGEEIVISFRSSAVSEYTTLSMRVKNVGQIADNTDSSAKKVFCIYLVTTDTYRDSMIRASMGARGTYSDIVPKVFAKLLSNRTLEVDPTVNILAQFAVPAWPVLKAIDYMADRSFDENHMPFVFYEDFTGYHFKSLGVLFNQGTQQQTEAEKKVSTPHLWRDPKDAPMLQDGVFNSERFMRNILHIERKINRDQLTANFKDVFSFQEQLYDFDSKTMTPGQRNYLGWFEKTNHLDQYPMFMDVFARESSRLVVRSFDGAEAVDYPRRVIQYTMASTMARVLLVGDNRMAVGQVFQIDDISNRPKLNEQIAEVSRLTSGRYIITKLRHKLSRLSNDYMCIAEISKDSLSTQVLPPASSVQTTPVTVDFPATDVTQAQEE